jgi:heat shock protein HtpX
MIIQHDFDSLQWKFFGFNSRSTKRSARILLTNIAVILALSIIARVLGVDLFLTSNGLNMGILLAFSALIGFGGPYTSLMVFKTMTKWSTRRQDQFAA